MRIADIEIYRFRLPFVVPIKVGRQVLHDREGFILALTDEEGRTGYGEIAPLPGLGHTTLELCRQELPALKGLFTNTALQCHQFDIMAPLLGLASLPFSCTTHTLFGLESAMLDLLLQQPQGPGQTPKPFLPDPLIVPISGLFIPGIREEAMAVQIQKLKAARMKTVKVKIGRLPAEEEIHQILCLALGIGADMILRLDGNRNLTPDAYLRYYTALNHLTVEYVEEPLDDGEPVPAGAAPWPVALDESLGRFLDPDEPRPSRLPQEVRTIILKPGLLMGLHAMARCIADADRVSMRTTLSSAFNTGITLAILSVFSRLAGLSPDIAHGFDTMRYLAADVLSEPLIIDEGALVIPGRLLTGGQLLNADVIQKEGI